MNSHEELTPQEQAVLQQLQQPVQPDNTLEEITVQRLKNENLLNTKKINYMIWSMGIAASLLLLVAGVFIGKMIFSKSASEIPSFNYMLVLYEDARFNPEEPEAMFNEYSAWMQNIEQQGITIDGQEMKPSSVLIEQNGIVQSSDAEKKVGGYFVLNASSMEEVVAIAKNSPHLKYGGTIEVKEFMIR